MEPLIIANGDVLLPDGEVVRRDVRIADGRIEAVGPAGIAGSEGRVIDASGRMVLPGIVDIHGDAFERQIMPRPGVHFGLDVAFLDTDSQMVSNGITTAFHGVTFSWEPGLRGRDNFVKILDALEGVQGALRCDTRIHMRFETFNIEAADDAAQWIADGRIGLLAFNDHTPEIYEKRARRTDMTKYAERTGLDEDDFVVLLESVHDRAGEVAATIERLADVARDAEIPLLSHDDASPETRTYYNGLGCTICEFPETEDTARQARAYANPIVMGAPNVVRGGSHNGAIGAEEMIGKGLCNVLASDYYYPSQLLAAFRLHRQSEMPLGAAWALVSRAPAVAAGLDDRGDIAEGRRADIVIVDAGSASVPRAVATIAGGRPVFLA